MKKLIPLVAVLGAAVSFGTTIALADGGETGADAAHTQPYWSDTEGSGLYAQPGPAWRSPANMRSERNERTRGYNRYEVQ